MAMPVAVAVAVAIALLVAAGSAHAHLDDILSVSQGGGFLCKECLVVANDAQEYLSSPDNLDSVVDFVKGHGCASVPAAYKDKCNEMAEEYVSVAFTTLQGYLNPQKMCLETGICTAASAGGEDSRAAATCSACHFLASETIVARRNASPGPLLAKLAAACSRHQSIRDKCFSVLKQHGQQLLKSPSSFCKESKLCNTDVRQGNNCALCRYLIIEMRIKLQDPKAQEKLIQFLLENCQKLHSHEDECKLLVLEYGPQILTNLETLLEDDQLCSRIGMCSNSLQDM